MQYKTVWESPRRDGSQTVRLFDSLGLELSRVEVSLNRWGLRDPLNETDPRENHVILAGCSFVFGLHLPFEDTLTALLRRELPGANVRNFSVSGGGLSTALRFLETTDFSRLIPERKGKYVYVFIRDHLRRWNLDDGYLVWAPGSFPYYTMGEEISFAGNLEDFPRWQEVRKNPGLKILGKFAPHGPIVRGLVRLRDAYLSRYPVGEFIVYLHPLNPLRPRQEDAFLRELRSKGITVMKGAPLDLPEHESFVPDWNHPSAKVNALVAAELLGLVRSEGPVKR